MRNTIDNYKLQIIPRLVHSKMKKVMILHITIGLLVLFFSVLFIQSNNSFKIFFHQKDSNEVNSDGNQKSKELIPPLQNRLKVLAEELRAVPVASLDVMAAQEQGLIYPEIKDYSIEVTFNRNFPQGKQGLTYIFYQPLDNNILKEFEIFFPSGLEIINSNSIDEDELIGEGIYNFTLDGVNSVSQITILNSRDTQGHDAHWKFYFGPRDNLSNYYLSAFFDRGTQGVFKMVLARKFLFEIRPPIKFQVNLYTTGDKSHTVFVVPRGGNRLFRETVIFVEGNPRVLQASTNFNNP